MPKRVFVSSTLEDLIAHRQAVAEQLRGLGWQSVEVVEFGNRRHDLLQISLHALRETDLFIGLYAARYGPLLPGQSVSLDEMVYDAAREWHIPRLIYIVSPQAQWTLEYLQPAHDSALWRMFLDRLQAENTHLRYFTTPQDLAGKIAFDVTRLYSAQEPRRVVRRHVWLGAALLLALLVGGLWLAGIGPF